MSAIAIGPRRFHRRDLPKDDQRFLALLAVLGLGTWSMLVYSGTLPPPERIERERTPVRVARVRLAEPPPKPEPKEVEPPKPEPPRPVPKKEAKPKAEPKKAPPKKVEKAPKIVAKAPPKRKPVASRGLLAVLSKRDSRESASSQRIVRQMETADLRDAPEVTTDVSTMTGSMGARRKATVAEIEQGLGTNTGREVKLEGKVVTKVSGPDAPVIQSASGDGAGEGRGRTLGEVRAVVSRQLPGLKWLYDRELKRQPSLGGKVTVEFEIQPAGTVSSVRLVDSGLGHGGLEKQIMSRIRTWRFPQTDGPPTRVTFPFDFVSPAG